MVYRITVGAHPSFCHNALLRFLNRIPGVATNWNGSFPNFTTSFFINGKFQLMVGRRRYLKLGKQPKSLRKLQQLLGSLVVVGFCIFLVSAFIDCNSLKGEMRLVKAEYFEELAVELYKLFLTL
jgi:hypothetical protein